MTKPFDFNKPFNTGPIQTIYYISPSFKGDFTLQEELKQIKAPITFFEPDEAQQLCKDLIEEGQKNGDMIIRQKELLKRLDEITKKEEEIDDFEW